MTTPTRKIKPRGAEREESAATLLLLPPKPHLHWELTAPTAPERASKSDPCYLAADTHTLTGVCFTWTGTKPKVSAPLERSHADKQMNLHFSDWFWFRAPAFPNVFSSELVAARKKEGGREGRKEGSKLRTPSSVCLLSSRKGGKRHRKLSMTYYRSCD